MVKESDNFNRDQNKYRSSDGLTRREEFTLRLEKLAHPDKPAVVEKEDGTTLIDLPKSMYKFLSLKEG